MLGAILYHSCMYCGSFAIDDGLVNFGATNPINRTRLHREWGFRDRGGLVVVDKGTSTSCGSVAKPRGGSYKFTGEPHFPPPTRHCGI